jgi:hypothetical protein
MSINQDNPEFKVASANAMHANDYVLNSATEHYRVLAGIHYSEPNVLPNIAEY